MPIVILTVLSFVYYFGSSILLYFSLHANAWDLGVFNQVLFNTAHGDPFIYSFRPFGNYLGDHFSPILFFLSPLTFFKTSIPLLFIQALALSLAVFVLYKLSKKILGGQLLPLVVAFSFASNPFTLQIINFDFHPDSFFPVFFFASLYFVLKKDNPSKGLSFLSILLLQLVREDAFLLIFPLAVVFFWHFKEKKSALALSAFSLVYTAVVILYLMPKIRGISASPLSDHYPYLGGNFGQIALTIITQPQLVIQKLLGSQELTTVIKFFAGTGFLSFFSPVILISSVPIFAAHLLSVVPMRINFQGHYSAEPISVMFLALIFGLTFLQKKFGRQRLLALYLTVNTVISFILFSPSPPSFSADVNRFTVNAHTKLFFELKKLIPDDASVSAQTNLVPVLAFRREIYEFPDLRKADYVFFDAQGSISTPTLSYGFFQLKNKLPSLGYKLIKDEDGFQIYKLVNP